MQAALTVIVDKDPASQGNTALEDLCCPSLHCRAAPESAGTPCDLARGPQAMREAHRRARGRHRYGEEGGEEPAEEVAGEGRSPSKKKQRREKGGAPGKGAAPKSKGLRS